MLRDADVGLWFFMAACWETFADDGFGNLIPVPDAWYGAALYHPCQQDY